MKNTKRARKAKPRLLTHHGKLYTASLFSALPPDLIVRTFPSTDDPFALAWEVPRSNRNVRLSLTGLMYATAEAVVALACITERFRLSAREFRVTVDGRPTDWADAVGLAQLQNGQWTESRNVWQKPFGCHVLALKRFEISSLSDAAKYANDIVAAIGQLPNNVLGTGHEDILSAVARITHETLLNVWEHAYKTSEPRTLFTCATVTPAGYFEEQSDLHGAFVSRQERDWLSEFQRGLILEIAIGDAGEGIPKTLWRNARDRGRGFAALWKEPNFSDEDRASAHHKLCEYAFHHESSRKQPSEFPTAASRLSWRGLHRCLRQVEYLSGCMFLASGQGRAGYAVVGDRLATLSAMSGQRTDFPGTVVVLRVPAAPRRRDRRMPAPTSSPAHTMVGYIATEEHLRRGVSGEEVTRTLIAKQRSASQRADIEPDAIASRPLCVIAACFSFRRLARIDEVAELLHSLPPNHVAVLLFAHIPPEVCRELRAHIEADDLILGTPRLIAVWDVGRGSLAWQVAGDVPTADFASRVCTALEEKGHADLVGENTRTRQVARDLAETYPDYLGWNELDPSIRFLSPELLLSLNDYAAALNQQFSEFMDTTEGKQFIASCSSGEAIRIPTGRLVRRFLSVLPMMQNNKILAAAVGDRLFDILRVIGQGRDVCLVTDSLASYFLATVLLRNRRDAPPVRLISQANVEIEGEFPVLFVDVIFRGETINKLANDLERKGAWSRAIVACVDMRRMATQKLLGTKFSIHSLLQWYLDPEEMRGERPSRVIEIDSVTHSPIQAPCEFTDLGTNRRRDDFLREHPYLFTAAFHRISDGQAHTVSLNSSDLVGRHRAFVAEEIVDEIKSFGEKVKAPQKLTDCVIFCRPESRLYAAIPTVARGISERVPKVRHVFIATLTVGPTSPRSIFPRAENTLLADIHVEGGEPQLFPPSIEGEFLGVYLDDAAMTGRSLQDLVSQVTRLRGEKPYAMLALVLVNRLSPRETRFLNLFRSLAPNPERQYIREPKATPFEFRSLFRLQVKMAGETEADRAGSLIRRLNEHVDYFDERLKRYVGSIAANLDGILRANVQGQGATVSVSHPFWPDRTEDRHASFRVVRLQHLLSLNKQNEGVVSEVLTETTELCETGETSLLAMLAREPGLLEDDPLAMECWPSIKKLCLRVITGGYEPPSKSDALAILCLHPDEFIEVLDQCLPYIAADDRLADQAAAFLLAFSRKDGGWRTRIRQALGATGIGDRATVVERLRIMLDIPERVETRYIVRDEGEAEARIRGLVAASWTHIGSLNDWQSFDSEVKKLIDEPLSAEAIQLGLRCVEFAEQVLLPGVAGIRFLAAKRLRPQDAHEVWDGFIEATRRTLQLRSLLEAWPIGEIADLHNSLASTWNQLRKLTLRAASPDQFLGRRENVSKEPSLIEDFLPRLFAAPFNLAQGIAQRDVPDLQNEAEGTIFSSGIILVPVPRTLMSDFFSIIFGNMAKHGLEGRRRAAWRLRELSNEAALEVELTDDKRSDISAGNGMGTRLLREMARQGRFEFNTAEDDSFYKSCVIFHRPLLVYPEIQRA